MNDFSRELLFSLSQYNTDPQFFRRQGKYPFLIHPNISNANTPNIAIDNLSELMSNIFKVRSVCKL
uniref:Uncharacterized protein n=1 Tax=Rhizophagus irregularis (strain DAOM 181602 / DAOM 197198 / MUCL 43194) TaxID=747089 RepID=U9TP70_RHIID